MTLNLMAEPAFQYVTHTEYLLKLTKKQPNKPKPRTPAKQNNNECCSQGKLTWPHKYATSIYLQGH